MRLLQINSGGDLSLVEYFGNDIPPYAILSHTWGADDDEISFKDVKKNRARSKPSGYHKVRFCGDQALRDGIDFFWVDTCCIKQESSQEVAEAINSMFRWYHDAVTCYVYLADVSVGDTTRQNIDSELAWLSAFRGSRWFTRGWTLQELLAPVSAKFFSQDGYQLGDQTTLLPQIEWITGIPEAALSGSPLSNFTVEERISWARKRITKREEDAAYSLLGLFGIHMPLIYGEGRRDALKRLKREIARASREEPSPIMLNVLPALMSSAATPHPSGISTAVIPNRINHARVTGENSRRSVARAPTHAASSVHFIFRIDEARQESTLAQFEEPTLVRVNEGIVGKWWMCGSGIYETQEPPATWRPFDATSVYYSSGKGFLVAQGDVTAVRPELGTWHNLSFDHNEPDFSSSLNTSGKHKTLSCQRFDSIWARVLLPDVYHGNFTPFQVYGGLRGSLSTFLALMAFSVKPNKLAEVMPKMRKDGKWRCRERGNGWYHNRGVVVYVYCSSDPGSTAEDLRAYENGAYGNYFD